MATVCMVASCAFLAESSLDDFLVCALHDHPATRGILEELKLPGAYTFSDERPIVLPVGDLLPEHLEPREAGPDAIRAGDCPRLALVPDGPGTVHPNFDLTR